MKLSDLKFRVWDQQLKVMSYFDLGMATWCIPTDCRKNIMQWTGLKDKNGRLIFEDDLLSGRGNPILVKYSAPEFQFVYKNPEVSWMTHCVAGWGDISSPEVIGNIHENPNLSQ